MGNPLFIQSVRATKETCRCFATSSCGDKYGLNWTVLLTNIATNELHSQLNFSYKEKIAIVGLTAGTYKVLAGYDGVCNIDNYGNITIPPPVVNVTSAINSLIDYINNIPRKPLGNGPVATLKAALASCHRGNTTAFVNQLNAFINQVNSGRPGLTLEQANTLITAAENLIIGTTNGSITCGASNRNKMEAAGALEETEVGRLTIKATPNPAPNYFTLQLKGSSGEGVQIKVTDIVGRTVEQRSVGAGSSLKIGHRYRPGVYLVEAVQGKEKVTLKLVKGSQ